MSTNPQPPQIKVSPGFLRIILIGFLAFILFAILTSTMFLTINPGNNGVIFKRFGGGVDKENILKPGFHVIAPWNKVYIYNVRLQEATEDLNVLSKNGLNITIDLTYRYKPIASQLGYLHSEIGTDYLSSIIEPEIRSATREVIGKYLPEELYSTKRDAIQIEIFNQTKKEIEPHHVDIDAILIRGVRLPESLEAAIERKLKEEQSSLEYEYRLNKERKEAERKLIEAHAKADANKVLSASLNEKILRDKGIEATMELAKSPNSKVVIIGGEDGLPIILNN